MKRFLSILLVAVLAVGLMATSALAADPTVSLGDPAVSGKTATVTLSVDDLGDLGEFQSCLATINYDHSKLALTNVEAGERLAGAQDVSAVTDASQVNGTTSMYAWNEDNNGTAMIAYATADNISATGIIFKLTFTVLDGTDNTVSAALTLYNANGSGAAPVEVKAESSDQNIHVDADGIIIGDVNGDKKVDGRDLVRLKRYLAGIEGVEINVANTEMINGKAGVNGQDAVRLSRFLAGISGVVLG